MRGRRFVVVLLILAALGIGAYASIERVLGSDLVRSGLEQQLAARLGQPVRIGSASVSLVPRVAVVLREVIVGEPAVLRLGNVRLVTGLRPLFSRTIADAEIAVSESRVEVPQLLALLRAVATPAASVPQTSPSLTVASVRRLALKDITLTAGQQALHVDLESSIEGDRLDIVKLSAHGATTRIEGRGGLTSLARLEGHLEATADPLDIDETIAIGTALTASPSIELDRSAATPAAPMPMRITIALKAPAGRFASYTFRDLSGQLDLRPARFALAPLSVGLLGGRFQGRADADTTRRTPVLRLTGTVEGLDMPEVMKATGSPGSITGRLGGTVALTAEGTDVAALMRTARGTIAAVVTNGVLPGLEMVRPIVLAFGKPSGAPTAGTGSAFSRIAGSFVLADATLTTDNLTLASRDFDMAGRGTLRLTDGVVNATSDVVLSAELTSQSGTDLRRYAQENGRVTVPATIRGSLAHPEVWIDVAAATRRAMSNELKRRVNDFLGGLFKKKK